MVQRATYREKLLFLWRLGLSRLTKRRSLLIKDLKLLPPVSEIKGAPHRRILIILLTHYLFFIRFRGINGYVLRPLRLLKALLPPMRRKRKFFINILDILQSVLVTQLLQLKRLNFTKPDATALAMAAADI